MTRNRMAAAAATIALAALVGCGGDDGGGGADSAGGGKAIENAKTIDVGSMDGAKGEIKYCQGKDTTGETKAWGKQFNEKYKSQGLSVKIIEFPASADEQRTQFVQRQEAKSGDCDVFRSDVIWTAEFASQGWLYDLTPYIEDRRDELHPARDRHRDLRGQDLGRAALHQRGAALLPHGQDRPGAGDLAGGLQAGRASNGGIVFQGAAYEGLTCDWLEIAYAAGGSVISEDGKKATIDSPENVAATKLMADAVKSGAAPKAVATYMEPESLTAWQTGKPAMMRNWPYAYGLSQDTPKLKGKFDVAPLPSFEGAGKAAILGGGNNVVSVYSKNPGGALAVVDFLAQQDWQTQLTAKFSQASPLKGTYDQPEVKKAIPFSDDLLTALEQAKPRPVSPVYPQISQAIYKNVNQALVGQMSPEDAMKNAQSDIEKALSTF